MGDHSARGLVLAFVVSPERKKSMILANCSHPNGPAEPMAEAFGDENWSGDENVVVVVDYMDGGLDIVVVVVKDG